MQKTLGIVLHTTAFKEKDAIVKIYTKTYGNISFLIQNIKSAKAKIKPSFLQPLTILEISFDNIANKGLQKISDATIHLQTPNISSDIQKSSILYFMNEVLYKSIKEEECNEKLFKFITDKIMELNSDCKLYYFSIQFLIELTYYLGFFPNDNHSNSNCFFDMMEGSFVNYLPKHHFIFDPQESNILIDFINGVYEKNIDRNQRNLMLSKLLDYYKLHISNFGIIKSVKVLNEVFE